MAETDSCSMPETQLDSEVETDKSIAPPNLTIRPNALLLTAALGSLGLYASVFLRFAANPFASGAGGVYFLGLLALSLATYDTVKVLARGGHPQLPQSTPEQLTAARTAKLLLLPGIILLFATIPNVGEIASLR